MRILLPQSLPLPRSVVVILFCLGISPMIAPAQDSGPSSASPASGVAVVSPSSGSGGEEAGEGDSSSSADEGGGRGTETGQSGRIGLLVEAKSINPKVFSPIEGAQKTVLAAAHEWSLGIKLYNADDWKAAGLTQEKLFEKAEALADEMVSKIEPQFKRDHRGIIQYASVHLEDPFLSSILLSEKLLPRFQRQLGDQIHVVIPDRYTVYLFPALGNPVAGFGKALVEQYEDAAQPISLEVFEVDRNGYRVIGAIEG